MIELTTTLEESKFDNWRETRIEYMESLGETYKSLSVEMHLTLDELMTLVREMLGGDAE